MVLMFWNFISKYCRQMQLKWVARIFWKKNLFTLEKKLYEKKPFNSRHLRASNKQKIVAWKTALNAQVCCRIQVWKTSWQSLKLPFFQSKKKSKIVLLSINYCADFYNISNNLFPKGWILLTFLFIAAAELISLSSFSCYQLNAKCRVTLWCWRVRDHFKQ